MAELKPGQKHPTPTPGFGDRVFYETLLRQRPDSAMAQQWCVEYGVLPHDEAAKLYKKVLKRKATKGSEPLLSPKKKKKKPKLIKEEGVDPDVPMSTSGGGGEAIGSAVL